jgi:hypothetical protein
MQQLLQQEQELVQEDESYDAVPICGGNFYTPVTDTINYLDEVNYTIGGRKYIENAD